MKRTLTSRGSARRWLVEKQDAGPGRQRDGDLDQALLAVREAARHRSRVPLQPQFADDVDRLVDLRGPIRDARLQAGRDALALEDGEHDRFQHRQPGKEGGDLEGASHSALHALVLREAGDLVGAEVHRAAARRKGAGQEVHEGGLARAVGPDERVASARLEGEGHLSHRLERAEAP